MSAIPGWGKLKDLLVRWSGRTGARVKPHPPAESDQGERRMERESMEGQTRHVGSVADAEKTQPMSGEHP